MKKIFIVLLVASTAFCNDDNKIHHSINTDAVQKTNPKKTIKDIPTGIGSVNQFESQVLWELIKGGWGIVNGVNNGDIGLHVMLEKFEKTSKHGNAIKRLYKELEILSEGSYTKNGDGIEKIHNQIIKIIKSNPNPARVDLIAHAQQKVQKTKKVINKSVKILKKSLKKLDDNHKDNIIPDLEQVIDILAKELDSK